MSAALNPPQAAPARESIRHPYWVLGAVCALALMSTVGVSMPYPILAPIFVDGPHDAFTHFLGLDPKLLMGLALAVNPLGILLGSLFIGPLSDRYGRRLVLNVTLTATLLGYLLTAYALHQRWYLVFVLARFVSGITEGNVAVARALVADLHGQVDRVRGLAWLNACLYAGWLLGPLVGGLTLGWGEPVPFVLAGLAMLPCLVVLAAGVPAGRRQAGPLRLMQALREQQALGLLRDDPVLARLGLLQLLYTLGITALYEFAPLWMLEQAGLDSRGIAWVTAAQCATMTLASVLAGRFGSGRRAHPLRDAAWMALAAAVGLSLLAVLPASPGLFMIASLGLPLALYNAVMPAWMAERFAQHGQGRVMGLLSTIFCLANVLVALLGAGLSLLSSRWIMGLGGVTCVLAAWQLLALARVEGQRSEGQA